MQNKEYSLGVIQPLIGGMAFGASKALGVSPSFVLSFNGVDNDSHYLDYLLGKKEIDESQLFTTDAGFFDDDFHDIENKMQKPEVQRNCKLDVIVGVPFCNGASNAGLKLDSERETLFNNIFNIAEYALHYFEPQLLILENSEKINNYVYVRNKLKKLKNKYNYNLVIYKTNGLLHNSIQDRARSYLIFSKAKLSPKNVLEDKTISFESVLNTENNYNSDEWPCASLSILGQFFKDKAIDAEYFGKNISMSKMLIELNLITEFSDWIKKRNIENNQVNSVIKYAENNKVYGFGDSILVDDDYFPTLFSQSFNKVILKNFKSLNIGQALNAFDFPVDFKFNIDSILNMKRLIGQNVCVNTAESMVKNAVKWLESSTNDFDENIVFFDNK